MQRINNNSQSIYQQAHLFLGSGQIQNVTAAELVQLPCRVLPVDRNVRFFAREHDLAVIDQYLTKKDAHGLRAHAVYGLGGVGKTQTALAYAYSKIDEYDAVLWIHAETEIALSSSLAEIAYRLKLPRATNDRSADNALLALQWLQTTGECFPGLSPVETNVSWTDKNWLAVYDNAEAGGALDRFWPKGSDGSILMTTRDKNLSRLPCAAGQEIRVFSQEEGAQFMLHLMAYGDVGRVSYTTEDKQAALKLSELVGGHALAITQLIGLIQTMSKSLPEFLPEYERSYRSIRGMAPDGGISADYKHLINTVFRDALSHVSQIDAFGLLGILSFLSPDGIPQELFEPPREVALQTSIEFCQGPPK